MPTKATKKTVSLKLIPKTCRIYLFCEKAHIYVNVSL